MKTGRIEYLDSLRGLASISVVISHFVLAYRLDLKFKLINYSPLHFFYDGFAAVTFFFVLSGYVLTVSLKNRESIELITFYLKRIFRIFPSYLVVLIVSLFLYSFFKVINTNPDSSVWINSFWDKPLNFINFTKQIFFIVPDVNFAELVCQNWSLNVEMKFSFLIPFLFIIYRKTNFIFTLVFNIVLYYLFNLPVYIFHFSLGITLAMNQDSILIYLEKIKKSKKLILVSFIILFYTYRYTFPMYYYYYFREQSYFLGNEDLIWAITGLGSFLILSYCFISIRFQKILNLFFLKFIGKISYSIYLTHMMLLIFGVPILIKYLNDIGLTDVYVIWVLSLSFLLFTTVFFSYLLTIFIEIPIANFGNKMINKYILHKAICFKV